MKKFTIILSGAIFGLMVMGAGCSQTPEPLTPVSPTPPVSHPTEPSTPSTPVVTPPTTPPVEQPPISTSTSSTSSTEKVYKLDITQWGVSLTLTKDIADLQYSLVNDGPGGNGYSYAYFSTKSLATKGGGNCEAPKGPIGALTRAKKLETEGPMSGQDAVKIGDYYYFFVGAQAPCSDNKSVQDMTLQQQEAVSKAAATVTLIK